MSLSYSRISLRDICLKLLLDSEEDAEYIVAKAIRDGVIDASIDHEHGHMRSKVRPAIGEIIYNCRKTQTFIPLLSLRLLSTSESGFVCRFIMNLSRWLPFLKARFLSFKAMRFPGDAHRKELASVQALHEEERKLAKEIVEGEMDEDEEMGDF